MMADWSLALRNLMRNRRRSLSTLIALAIGLTAILLFSGFKANLTYTGLTAFVRAGGHFQIQHRDYFLYGGGNPTGYGIRDYERLLDAVRKDPVLQPMLLVATPFLRFGGLAGNFEAGISRTVIGTGYDAEDINRMRQWNEFEVPLARLGFRLAGTPRDSAMLGVGLARVLQLCAPLQLKDCEQPVAAVAEPAGGNAAKLPSDIMALADLEHAGAAQASKRQGGPRIELLSNTARGAPNVTALQVVEAEDQGFKELDEVAVMLHLAQAQSLVFGREKPRVSAIMVMLSHTSDLAAARTRLQQIIDNHGAQYPLVIRDYEELNPFYVQTEKMFDVIFGFIFVLISGVVLFTVSNTMNSAVVERTVEIGTLRAIGLRQSGVRRLFVMEGFLLGIVGVLLGTVVALVTGELVNASGLTWLPPGSSDQLLLQLRVLGNPTAVGFTTVALVLITAGSAWWPAWRAGQTSVVEALRHA
jgi:putative ABC transport system permease protein